MSPELASLAARLAGAPPSPIAKRARARLADLWPPAVEARARRRDADPAPWGRPLPRSPPRPRRPLPLPLAARRPPTRRASPTSRPRRPRRRIEGPLRRPGRAPPRLPAAPRDDVVRAFRRARAEHALLVALADIGGVWSVEEVTAALSDFADASVVGAVGVALKEAAAQGRLALPNPDDPGQGLRLRRARARQARGRRAELLQRHRPRRVLRPRSRAARRRRGGRDGLHPHRPERRPAARRAHRRRLRPPRRLPPAPRPGLDADRRRSPVRLHLLRDRRAELGAGGADQGAPGRGRPRPRRALPRRPRPVHLAQILRLRLHRRRARHEAADPRRARARRDRGRRPRHQARARRHPRDRVLRPDAAARLRRAAAGACAGGAPSTCWSRSTTRAGSPRRRGTS